MLDVGFDPEAWLARLDYYESVVRLSAASAFGVSLLLAAFVLRQNPEQSSIKVSKVPLSQASRFFFVGGLVLSVFLFALTFASPVAPVSALMSLGLVVLLSAAVVALDTDRDRLPAFGFLTAALSWLLLVLTPFLYPVAVAPGRDELSHLGKFHVVSALVAASLFVLGVLTSMVYLFVHRRLRSKDLVSGRRLPGLDSLDRLVDRSTWSGLLVMTASLVTGLGLVYQGYSLGEVGAFKIFWAFGVWIWYVLAIQGRAQWGWRGKRGASASLVGGALLGLALFGSLWS